MPNAFSEAEITAPVSLCNADGTLNPDAVGWSRVPMHDCTLVGHWPRKKRWNYWCITSDTHLFSVTISNIDYAGVIFAYLLDFKTKVFIEETVTVPFGRGLEMPDGVPGVCRYAGGGVDLEFTAEERETRLRFDWKNFGGKLLSGEFTVAYPEDYESMSVVIPWDTHRFQYTSKHHGMAADGHVTVGDNRITFDPGRAYACLDFGRGVWPYSSFWNWGGGSGHSDGRLVGLNLGAGWTDGTGLTENGVIVDGRLRKIHTDLNFDYDSKDFMRPWRITSVDTDEVDLTFTPFFERLASSNLLIIKSVVHQMIGRYSGTILDPDGNPVRVDNLVGWAEEHIARW